MSDVNGHARPTGWASVIMGDLGSLVCGQSPPSETVNTRGDGVAYVSGPEHWDGSVLHLDKWTTAPSRIVSGPAIFVTVKGAGVGTIFPGADVAIGRDIYAFLPEEGISRSFVTHALRFTTADVVRQAQGDIPGLSKEHILRHSIPLPPANEQDRIAACIDELFSDLDAGVAAIERVREKLKLYRASVLKAAVEGALTMEWRAQHPHTELASELLERILAERRRRWEEDQLAKFKAKGEEPPQNWKAKYKEPVAPGVTSDWPIPSSWTWTGFEKLADGTPHAIKAGPFGSSLKKEYYTASGYKIYGQEQVIRGDAHFGDYFISDERFQLLRTCAVKPGDVLISLVGTTGKVLVLPDDVQPGIINPRLLKVSLSPHNIDPRFVKLVIESPHARLFFKVQSHGGTMEILNLGILKRFPIPLPPLTEQRAIVDEVDDQHSVIDHLEADLDAALKNAESLRQAILRHAFTGQLVPQDPNDEPASELLKRVAAEREARGAPVSRRRRARS